MQRESDDSICDSLVAAEGEPRTWTAVAQVPLVGRQSELAVLRSFVAEAAAGRGGALVVTGAPGIGKSALLHAAAQEAGDARARVLRASGVEFEADIAFSGLNRLVLPLSETVRALDPRRGKALSVAFGFDDAAVVERVAVADATVALVRQGAASQPLLLVVDDIMWLDRSTAFVLGFVARRLAESRAALIVTSRPHEDSFFDRAGLPELSLGPLDDAEAVELLRPHGAGLVPAVVDRLVREAGGNPLALVELPRTLTAAQRWGTEPLPPVMPLTRRLHALFAPRVAALDAATRRLLLVAALEGTGDVKILRRRARGRSTLLERWPAPGSSRSTPTAADSSSGIRLCGRPWSSYRAPPSVAERIARSPMRSAPNPSDGRGISPRRRPGRMRRSPVSSRRRRTAGCGAATPPVRSPRSSALPI